jgi:hypothetical protein
MAESKPLTFLKLSLAVAAGMILASIVIASAIGFVRAVSRQAELDKFEKMAADMSAIAECRRNAILAAKTIAQVPELSRPCEDMEGKFRAKWNREPN